MRTSLGAAWRDPTFSTATLNWWLLQKRAAP
jgi:hypothetical protein